MSADAAEIIARAICNAQKPKPFNGDAYDLLLDWAKAAVRVDPEAAIELSRFKESGLAAVAALEEAGLVIAPKEPTEKMIGAYVCSVKFSTRARDVARADKRGMHAGKASVRWRAMIEARPK